MYKRVLLGVYVDGQTKTGKGAASKAIATVLASTGMHVYYDVAGDFYRRYVAFVRRELGLGETDSLPTGRVLEQAAKAVYDRGQAFEQDETLGDLQRPAIGKSVSILGELPVAQKAGGEWWARSVDRAQATGAEVLVLDGRNPRSRIREFASKANVRTVLDLCMTCAPAEAARRTLLGNGSTSPSTDQIEAEERNVISRRERDRNRADHPFVMPTVSVPFVPDQTPVTDILRRSWERYGDAELPVVITFDNTTISKPAMLAAISELAIASVTFAPAELAGARPA